MYTFDENGVPIPELEEIYLRQDPLKDYGYKGFIGPEPHGTLPLNSASSVPKPKRGRDIGYTEQLIKQLDTLNNCKEPWLLVGTYVNPHDITLMGLYTDNNASGFDFPIDETLPKKLFTKEFTKSHLENLNTKPAAQKNYRDLYSVAIQPIINIDKYQRFYYSAQKYVDQNIEKVWKKLKSLDAYKNTIILFLSDHGELLASHGSMFQKWHNAYQETIHVPFIISSPLFGNKHHDVYELTSHIDILPTLLGFADANVDYVRNKLMNEFSLALPLPGRNLSIFFEKKYKNKIIPHVPIYFYTEDQPTKGSNQVNALCQPYNSVIQPNHVQALISKYKNKLWKITNYYGCDCTTNCPFGGITGELYNLENDPLELDNLINNKKYLDVQNYMNDLLTKYSFLYRGI